ncbi:MAG: PEGA domain-containing protein [Betaproteobacteria bacterium]
MTPWGEVLVNGTSRGVSPPLARLQLPPGVYQIEVRNGASQPYRARVEVKPGQTISLQHRF